MNSELEILKTIWGEEGKSSIRPISKQTGLGIDYTRYLCHCLFKKEQLKPVKRRRDWYGITSKGRRELRLRKLIKPKAWSGVKEDRNKASPKAPEDFIEPREKKLKWGKSIAKAASLLERSKNKKKPG